MLRFSKITILIILLCVSVTSQDMFTSKGKPFAKVSQKTREPKIIVDTVIITAGIGVLNLNSRFTGGQHSVSATSTSDMRVVISQILADTTSTVYYYAYVPDSSGRTVWVKSSGGTSDTGSVSIIIYLK